MNEEPGQRKYSDPTPQISDPEQMPASLAVITKIDKALTKKLADAKYDQPESVVEVDIRPENLLAQQLYPQAYRLDVVRSDESRTDEETTNVYLRFPEYSLSYTIRKHHKSGLMEIQKELDLTEEANNPSPRSYEDNAKKILDAIKSSMLEDDTGMATVSLKEARDLIKLLESV